MKTQFMIAMLALGMTGCGKYIEVEQLPDRSDDVVHAQPIDIDITMPDINVVVEGDQIDNSNSNTANGGNSSSTSQGGNATGGSSSSNAQGGQGGSSSATGGSSSSNSTSQGGSSSATGGSNTNSISSGNSSATGTGGAGGTGGSSSAGNSTSNANNSGSSNSTNSSTNSGSASNQANNSTNNSADNSAEVSDSGNSTNTNTNSNENQNSAEVDLDQDFDFNIELDGGEDYFKRVKKDRTKSPKQCVDPQAGRNMLCHVYDFNGRSQLATQLEGAPHLGSFYMDRFDVTARSWDQGFPKFPASLSHLRENYAVRCFTKLRVTSAGVHTFSITSDDGMRVLLNNSPVLQDDGLHAPRTASAQANLVKGTYNMEVQWFQGPRTQIAAELKWATPSNATLRYIEASDTQKAKKLCQ